jgi:GNAT superfamily N-acetyltransferase
LSPDDPGRIARLEVADASLAADVLYEAFRDYPAMRYMLEPVLGDYDASLRRLIHFFVMARFHRDEPVLAIMDGPRALAATIVTLPPERESPAAVAAMREAVWTELGPAARTRYGEYGEACLQFELDRPTVHLNMIGVREAARGMGLGRLLIERVHELSRANPESVGVTLTTELAENVPLYEHLGYRIIGHVEFGDGVETWGFFRPDR